VTYLLDTNAWIWSLDAPEKLPTQVKKILRNTDNLPLGLSAISPWELIKKESKGLLQLSTPIGQWIERATLKPFIKLLPLSIEISLESSHLPGEFHKDPADQIITATARVLNLTLISSDKRLLNYAHVKTLWQ